MDPSRRWAPLSRTRGVCMTDASVPDIIDVEASGFGRGSYPIEIGVALASGRTECFLVRPYPDWTHWSPDAEALHGIARDILHAHGHPPEQVARALNACLEQRTVYTDAWGMDSSWLALLHERTGVPAHYRIEALSTLLDEEQRADWAALKLRVRDEMGLERHRASADALVLQRAYLACAARPRQARAL